MRRSKSSRTVASATRAAPASRAVRTAPRLTPSDADAEPSHPRAAVGTRHQDRSGSPPLIRKSEQVRTATTVTAAVVQASPAGTPNRQAGPSWEPGDGPVPQPSRSRSERTVNEQECESCQRRGCGERPEKLFVGHRVSLAVCRAVSSTNRQLRDPRRSRAALLALAAGPRCQRVRSCRGG